MYHVVKNGKTLAAVSSVDDAKSKVKIFAPKKGDVIAVYDDAGNEVDISDCLPTFQKKAWGSVQSKPKAKKNDVIDDRYTAWLCTQPCVVTGRTAARGAGANDMHGHHIYGRGRGRDDHAQVPLMGYVHSWGMKSYHSCGREDFKAHWGLIVDDVVSYFQEHADRLRDLYLKEKGDATRRDGLQYDADASQREESDE